MGAQLAELNEELAIRRSSEIPWECRAYISHHVRNGLSSIMGLAFKLEVPTDILDQLEEQVMHIACDLDRMGL